MMIESHRIVRHGCEEITCVAAPADGTLVEASQPGPHEREEVPMSIIPSSVIRGGALALAVCFG